MNNWMVALVGYILLALSTFIPVALRLTRGVKLNPGGPSFDESSYFSKEAQVRLEQHWNRLRGTLGFWKTQASKYKAFHT